LEHMLPISPEENWNRLLNLSKRFSYTHRGIVKCVDIAEAQLAPNGLVDVRGDIHMPVEGEIYFDTKVYFGHVTGSFVSTATTSMDLSWLPRRIDEYLRLHLINATSLSGITEYVGSDCTISGPLIESLDHIPHHIGYCLNIANTNIRCLHNIHIKHPYFNATMVAVRPHTTHLLGLSFLECDRVLLDTTHALGILRDPFSWQEHLLDLGLVEQAQL